MTEWIIGWVVMGLIANFLQGYTKPSVRLNRKGGSFWSDWAIMLCWPIAMPALVNSAGAALRMGWKA